MYNSNSRLGAPRGPSACPRCDMNLVDEGLLAHELPQRLPLRTLLGRDALPLVRTVSPHCAGYCVDVSRRLGRRDLQPVCLLQSGGSRHDTRILPWLGPHPAHTHLSPQWSTACLLPGFRAAFLALRRMYSRMFCSAFSSLGLIRMGEHGACSAALSESLLVSYRPLALELSSSRARRNPLVLCLAGIREIRGLPGYAKYYRVFWKTRSRCRRAWRQRAGPYDVGAPLQTLRAAGVRAHRS